MPSVLHSPIVVVVVTLLVVLTTSSMAMRLQHVVFGRSTRPIRGYSPPRASNYQTTVLLFSSSSSSSSKKNYELPETTTTTTLPRVPPDAHRMVLMRHGESEFNNANIFTGWCDVALTPRGVVEAVEAGQVFASHQMVFDHCYTSLLTRSIVTAHRSLEAAGIAYTPISYDWRLNERHYGALQGLSKERTAERLGRSLVMKWRRSYDAVPPLMTPEHPHYEIIHHDPRYQQPEQIKDGSSDSSTTSMCLPLGESLEQCQHRVIQAWTDIVSDISKRHKTTNNNNKYSLMVAHANTLRALVMHLDDIDPSRIEGLNIPTAIPFYYDVDIATGRVIDSSSTSSSSSSSSSTNSSSGGTSGHFRGIYIADERKKRSFLERRRAANDPWLWALHDHQVEESMLLGGGGERENNVAEGEDGEGLVGLEEEAKHNTEVFSSALHPKDGTK
jgi:2,3-bisphosphoglycerate-dependent phosphoglycerate mutase